MVKEKKPRPILRHGNHYSQLDVDGSWIRVGEIPSCQHSTDFNLATLGKEQAAHLVRRIMAECGLTLLDVAMEPSQLAGENSQPAATLRAMKDTGRGL